MAKGKKTIEQYDHKDKARVNNPKNYRRRGIERLKILKVE